MADCLSGVEIHSRLGAHFLGKVDASTSPVRLVVFQSTCSSAFVPIGLRPLAERHIAITTPPCPEGWRGNT